MARVGFNNLLLRAAAEHVRETNELRAEIAKLRGERFSQGDSPTPAAAAGAARLQLLPNTMEDFGHRLLRNPCSAARKTLDAEDSLRSSHQLSLSSSQCSSRVRSGSPRAITSFAWSGREPEPAPESVTQRSFGGHDAGGGGGRRGGAGAGEGRRQPDAAGVGPATCQQGSPSVVPRLVFPNAKALQVNAGEQWGRAPDEGALAAALSIAPKFYDDEEIMRTMTPMPRPAAALRSELGELALHSKTPPRSPLASGSPRELCSQRGKDTTPRSESKARKDRSELLVPPSDPALTSARSHKSENGNSPMLLKWEELLNAVKEKASIGVLPKLHWSWTIENKTLSAAIFNAGVVSSLDRPDRKRNCDSTVSPHDAKNPEPSRCQFRAIHPNNKARMAWDIFGVLFLTHDLIMIPILIGFKLEGLGQTYSVFKVMADLTSAVFWTTDIMVSFFTGFHNNEGYVQRQLRQVMRNYIKTWFPIDLSIVTVDWLQYSIDVQSSSQYMSSVQQLMKTFAKILRVFRLFRFMKMNKSVSELLERINSEYILTVVRLLKHLVMIVLINHYIACFWFGLSQITSNEPYGNWVQHYMVDRGLGDDIGLAYATSLHWSLTQFTPASMEIFPRNVFERTFNVSIIVFALLVFSSFVSSITNEMTHIRNINVLASEQESKIRRYFSENGINHDLASRVWHFVRQNRIVAARRLRLSEVTALHQLPMRLKEELHQEVYIPALSVHPLLKRYSMFNITDMRRLCKKAIREISLKSGDALMERDSKEGRRRGETQIVKRMVFVLFGVLEYHTPDAEEYENVTKITAGQWACEAALWAEKATIHGTLVAGNGGCDVILLDAEEFRVIATGDPETSRYLTRYAEFFVARFVSALQDPAFDDILFNSTPLIEVLTKEAFDLTNKNSGEKFLQVLMHRQYSATVEKY